MAHQDRVQKRFFSQKQRDKLANTGAAMPDGSFPIKNMQDMHNAVHLVGRASDPAAAKAHIIRRAHALGATSQLPPDWQPAKKGDRGSQVEETSMTQKTEFAKLLKFNPNHDAQGRFASATDGGARETPATTTTASATSYKPDVAALKNPDSKDGAAVVHATGGEMTSGNQGHTSTTQDESKATKVPDFVWANDVKRGVRVRLDNGWEARIEDNKKGNTRLATVYGNYTEMGSVYTKDIKEVQINGMWRPVKLSDAQAKAAKRIRGFGF